MKAVTCLLLLSLVMLGAGSCKKNRLNDNYIVYKGKTFFMDSVMLRNDGLLGISNPKNGDTIQAIVRVQLPSPPVANASYPVTYYDFNAISTEASVLIALPMPHYSESPFYLSTGTDHSVIKVSSQNGMIGAASDSVRVAITSVLIGAPILPPDTTEVVIHITQTE